ncbi:MAG TPA: tRNA preQ1(34) S-adenosylmethionine ribosyltransferase-isomerase QueA [Williamwhitmania sp.]|nr:tRNA preQ1(34) S-adenosylmethionine ribosyltransferase-isomerase QueA [Williamwhitmania sp.]
MQFIPVDIDNYTYQLPESRIAKFPVDDRDKSKLLIYKGGNIEDDQFANIPNLLKQKVFIFNNTKVIKARLLFKRATGATIEVFCLEPIQPVDYQEMFGSTKPVAWKCIVGNLKKWKEETLSMPLTIGHDTIKLEVCKEETLPEGLIIRFSWDNINVSFGQVLEAAGAIPIPPYLNRKEETIDETRYQTVYSKWEGSVAAPTAGLHFTESVIQRLKQSGSQMVELTLHVGAGTFKPVKASSISEHTMHSEHFSVPLESLEVIKKSIGDIIAVGTTSVRTLESLYWIGVGMINSAGNNRSFHLKQWDAYQLVDTIPAATAIDELISFCKSEGITHFDGSTQIMISPGYKFRLINGMITNFHQPRSTLLLLISAFIGDDWKKVYQHAMDNGYRFLSYGDSSLLLPASVE